VRLIKPSVEIISSTPDALKLIELAGRTCYKSEDKITEDSAEKFVVMILKRGHESVLEHAVASVRFVCDRGVSHELVRHRIASFSQESTRYVGSVDRDLYEIDNPDDVVEAYEFGMSMRRISELSAGKFTEWEVYSLLTEAGVKKRPGGNTGPVNDEFFGQIDTVEKAYLLGLIQADGSVREGKSCTLSISQHRDNSWYIQRMVRDFIRPSAKRVKDKNCHSVIITSTKLVSDLVSMGLVVNKTYKQTEEDIEKLWGSVPNHLHHAFIRGVLDGDGHIKFFNQSNPGATPSCRLSWCGNKFLMLRIQDWLLSSFGYSCKVVPNGTIWVVTVSKPSVAKQVIQKLLEGFVFPYGHPVKTARMIEQVGWEPSFQDWGDPRFQVIIPEWEVGSPTPALWGWASAMDFAEDSYRKLISLGQRPEQARSVLPNSLKTELVMTANLREWRLFFKLRTALAAHPQMREVSIPLLRLMQARFPGCFDDIEVAD